MKKDYSSKWKASKQPRKQRKLRANAPLHVRHKMMSSNLNKELRKKYDKRNFPVKKGDHILIMRSSFKGKKGKVNDVDTFKMRVTIEGIYRTKKDGTKVNVWFVPSNLQIQELNLEDKKRIASLERKATPMKKKELKVKALPKSEDKKETEGEKK